MPDTRPWLFEPDAELGQFRIMRTLGRGGMAEVYLARDTELGRKVAIKVIRRDMAGDQEAVDRFLFEARATARFSHPNIVQVHEVVWDLSVYYQDYCELLREVWRKVPVVWQGGLAAREGPPADHPCRQVSSAN